MATRCVPEVSITSPSENENKYSSSIVESIGKIDASKVASTAAGTSSSSTTSIQPPSSGSKTASTIVAATATPPTPSGESTTTSVSYSHNPNTTRSWPVIYRNPQQYDYETLYVLNNNNNCSSTEELSYDKYLDTNIYERARSQSVFHSYKMQAQTQTPATATSDNDRVTSGCCKICSAPTPVIFLFVTLLMTTSATAMLCAAIMTDHWEHVTWDRASLDKMTNDSTHTLQWFLDGRVAKLPLKGHGNRGVFLVPMHGGIWTLCIDLTDYDMRLLGREGFPREAPCVNYLAGAMENARGEEQRNDWQHSEFQATLQPHLRMQNLSISCSLVCLIILGSAALVGAFGVCQRQISAILVTGVMYLLAALFALFTLMIIHFKRQQGRPMLDSDFDGTVDGLVAIRGAARAAQNLLGARIFITSWSLDLGWGGVVLCSITSILWILLSKIMRYSPISAFMI